MAAFDLPTHHATSLIYIPFKVYSYNLAVERWLVCHILKSVVVSLILVLPGFSKGRFKGAMHCNFFLL